MYGAITLSNQTQDYRYQKASQINNEGVYYLMLVYAPTVVNGTWSNPYSAMGDDRLD
jgi:hypothetical protein